MFYTRPHWAIMSLQKICGICYIKNQIDTSKQDN